LGAGRPYRGSVPSALVPTSSGQVVLDWIFSAFDQLGKYEVHFMGGYGIDQIAAEFPNVNIVFNPDWSRTGSGDSLLRAPFEPDSVSYVCYADTVISAAAVVSLNAAAGEVVIGIDSDWRSRYDERASQDRDIAEKVKISESTLTDIGRHISISDADAEFTGLIKITPAAMPAFAEIVRRFGESTELIDVPQIIRYLIEAGIEVRIVDIRGQWAELNEGMDLARFVLRSKAESLEALMPLVTESVIDKTISISVDKWRSDTEAELRRVFAEFPTASLAVRSSASGEDSWAESHAGEFRTVLNVDGGDARALTAAINDVAASYSDHNSADRVLVQEMVQGLISHGVVLTRSALTGAPYYTVNFDENNEDTTTVTSGSSSETKTALIYRSATDIEDKISESIRNLIPAVQELERLVDHDSLDIEFAITKDGIIHVLQIRPLTTVSFSETEEWDKQIEIELGSIKQKVQSMQKSTPFLFGERSILGIMPDWNPAEIIGLRPRTLALSLYRFLVTDEVWSTQRREYGYRDVAPYPLLYELSGHPYIDTRVMFNSFIPAGVSDSLADRLVTYYLDRLEREPQLHDKVEFDIALTCLTFDFDSRVVLLLNAGFTADDIEELRSALHQITDSAPRRREGDFNLLNRLTGRYRQIVASDVAPLYRAFLLLEDCKRFGTLPFAHMARTGFIAVALLRSLETAGVTTSEQTVRFMEAAQTVAGDLSQDAALVQKGQLDWIEFVDRYGHLRPGTYDVTVRRYLDDPERYLRPLVSDQNRRETFEVDSDYWDSETRQAIAQKIDNLGFDWSLEKFENFIKQSIQDREYAKFVFSKNLSEALEQFVQFGEEQGITRDDVSYLDLNDIASIRNGEVIPHLDWLDARVDDGRRSQQISLRVELPPLIFDETEIDNFESWKQTPNFVTAHRVQAEVIELGDTVVPADRLEGRIVLIPNADPGYDWLLARPIAGLITMYGGANSHMSIRAAEMSLPAAIGVGERLYSALASKTELELDCEARRIGVVR